MKTSVFLEFRKLYANCQSIRDALLKHPNVMNCDISQLLLRNVEAEMREIADILRVNAPASGLARRASVRSSSTTASVRTTAEERETLEMRKKSIDVLIMSWADIVEDEMDDQIDDVLPAYYPSSYAHARKQKALRDECRSARDAVAKLSTSKRRKTQLFFAQIASLISTRIPPSYD